MCLTNIKASYRVKGDMKLGCTEFDALEIGNVKCSEITYLEEIAKNYNSKGRFVIWYVMWITAETVSLVSRSFSQ